LGKAELRSSNGETHLVIEVNSMDKIHIGIEDNNENIQDMVDSLCNDVANLVAKIGFVVGIETAKIAKENVFYDYFEIFVHNHEIEN